MLTLYLLCAIPTLQWQLSVVLNATAPNRSPSAGHYQRMHGRVRCDTTTCDSNIVWGQPYPIYSQFTAGPNSDPIISLGVRGTTTTAREANSCGCSGTSAQRLTNPNFVETWAVEVMNTAGPAANFTLTVKFLDQCSGGGLGRGTAVSGLDEACLCAAPYIGSGCMNDMRQTCCSLTAEPSMPQAMQQSFVGGTFYCI